MSSVSEESEPDVSESEVSSSDSDGLHRQKPDIPVRGGLRDRDVARQTPIAFQTKCCGRVFCIRFNV